MSKSSTISPLAALRSAIWDDVSATDAAVAALRAAGEETPEIKSLVLRTYMARRMNPKARTCTDAMIAEAAVVLDLPGAQAKTEGKKRTVEQERFYTGARQYLFSLRKKADVGAADPRGGANNTAPREPRTPDGQGDAATPAPKVKFETGLDLRAHLFQVGRTMMMLIEKHNTICDAKTRAAVTAFAKASAGWGVKSVE